MAINPITGQYTSPFSSSAGTFLPRMQDPYEGRRRYENPPGTMVSRALGRGVDLMQRNIGSAVEGVGNVTGSEALQQYGADVVDRNNREIARSAAMENDSPLDFLVSVLGENAPQLMTSVALPIIGGLIGGPGGAIAGGLKAFTAARGFAAGTAASAAFNYSMISGEMREAQKDENERRGLGRVVDEGKAFGTAIPATALETLSGALQARIAVKAAQRGLQGGRLKRAGREALRGAAAEAPTEIGQQAFIRAQADQTLADKEALTEYAIAGLAGGILGGTVGGLAGGLSRNPTDQDLVDQTDVVVQDDVPMLPPPAGELGQAQPEATPQGQPLELQPTDDTPAARPFQSLSSAQLVTQLQSLEQKIVSGQATAAEQSQLAVLRGEAEARDLAPELFSPETGIEARAERLFAGQKKSELTRAIKRLDTKAKNEGLSPEDTQIYRLTSTELARRESGQTTQAQADDGQMFLGDDFDPAVIQGQKDVKRFARENGMTTGSSFYRNLRARNIDELYDAVVNELEIAQAEGRDVDAPVGGLAYTLGIARTDQDSLQAEAERIDAQAQADVAALEGELSQFPDAARAQTPRGQQEFMAAQEQNREVQQQIAARQQEAAQQIAAVEQKALLVDGAIRRRETREAQAQASEAFVGPAENAQPLSQVLSDDLSDLSVAATSAQPTTVLGQRMQAAFIGRDQQAQFERALTQRQEQQFAEAEAAPDADTPPVVRALERQQQREAAREDARFNSPREQQARQTQEQQFQEAERALMEQEIAPTRVVRRDQPTQDTARIVTSRGDPVQLTRRDGAWYDGDTFVARKLKDAEKAVVARRDVEAGFRSSAWAATVERQQDLYGKSLQDKVTAIKGAVAKAMRNWESPYQVYVVRDGNDLPASLQGVANSAGVITPNGTVVLIASNIGSTDQAVATMYHEVLGHAGLQRMFGEQRAQVLLDLYNNNRTVRELVESWEYQLGDNQREAYANYPLHARVEEALATLSEAGPIRENMLQRLARVVRDFARRLGFRMELSRGEVRAIMAEAHARAMSPENPEAQVGQPDTAQDRPAREPVVQVNAAELQEAANTYGNAPLAAGMLRQAVKATAGVPDSTKGTDTALSRILKAVSDGYDKMRNQTGDTGLNAVRAKLYFQSLQHIRQSYGHLFEYTRADGVRTNVLKEIERALQGRAAIQNIFSRVATTQMSPFYQMNKQGQQDVMSLMSAPYLQLDPTKTLDQHKHLTPTQRMERASEHKRLRDIRNRADRQGTLKTYDGLRRVNEALYLMQHALDLYDVVWQNVDIRQQIPSAKRNPIKRFAQAFDIQSDPAAIRDFWQRELDALTKETKAVVKRNKTLKLNTSEAARINTINTSLEAQLTRADTQVRGMKDFPYFHLARFGKYAVSFSLSGRKDAEGVFRADPRAIEAVAEELHKMGYDNIELNENAQGASVFIRTESNTQARQIYDMTTAMVEQGYVDGTKKRMFDEVDQVDTLPEHARAILNSIITQIEANNAPLQSDDAQTVEAKQNYIARLKADAQAAFIARLPDRSVAKVMTRRGYRAGYDKNFMRGFAQRADVAANAAASRYANNIVGEALQNMTSQITAAGQGNPNRFVMGAIQREVLKRQELAPENIISGSMRNLRAYNHVHYLAMNPGYWLTQLTQMQTNVWPELMKSGASARQSFTAMTSTAPTAFKIVRAGIKIAAQQGFAEHAADSTITMEALNTIQLSQDPTKDAEMKQFVMRLFTSGVIDIGAQTRALGRASEGKNEGKFDFALRWAGSGSYHLEVLSRLNTAMAAQQVAESQGMDANAQAEYAIDVVNEAMLNYTEGNRARAFGRKGMIGEATPLAAAFMTFQFHMTEKYMREFGDAFFRAVPADQKRAARRWVAGHLTSIGMLAGTMGLPFVTVIARLIDALGDLLTDSEEPYDSKIAYRNFLAGVFGQDVGEVLARGIPRAAGFDISGRIGAADYFPFSRAIADRRDFEDSMGDLSTRMYGSAYAMAGGWAKGLAELRRGNVMSAMTEAMPTMLKSPLNAIKMTNEGFTDTRGNVLPLDATGRDIMYQALGISPARRAEYTEANFSQAVRRGVVGREATRIRKQIVKAQQAGDAAGLREALARAREFDSRVSPQFAVMPGLGNALRQAQTAQGTARGLGAPLNVRPQDRLGIEQTRFANY